MVQQCTIYVFSITAQSRYQVKNRPSTFDATNVAWQDHSIHTYVFLCFLFQFIGLGDTFFINHYYKNVSGYPAY